MDRQVALQYLPSRAFGAAGDNKGKNLKPSFSFMGQNVKKIYNLGLFWGPEWVFNVNDKTGHILLSSYPLTDIYYPLPQLGS